MNSSENRTTNSTEDFSLYFAALSFASVSFVLLSLVTIVGNGLFLLTFYKDPLKCLRTPSAVFIAGLTFTNFLTGLIAEPVFVWRFNESTSDYNDFFFGIELLAFVTINTSFFIMLSLGVVNYLAIAYPKTYETIVSPRKAVVGMVAIWIYVTFFAVLPFFGVNMWLFIVVDQVLHSTLLTIILMILYILMYLKFRKIADRHRSMEASSNGSRPGEVSGQIGESEQQRRHLEKDFAIGTFSLTVLLLFTVWPFCIIVYVLLFSHSSRREKIRLYAGVIICQVFLFTKFALDPFVFAWRLRKYRKSLFLCLEKIFPCCKSAVPAVAYHRNESDRQDSDQGYVDFTVVN